MFAAHEKAKNVDAEFEKKKLLSSVRRFQRFVSQKLAEFLQCDVHYTLRRVFTAENARLYKGDKAGGKHVVGPCDVTSVPALFFRLCSSISCDM